MITSLQENLNYSLIQSLGMSYKPFVRISHFSSLTFLLLLSQRFFINFVFDNFRFSLQLLRLLRPASYLIASLLHSLAFYCDLFYFILKFDNDFCILMYGSSSKNIFIIFVCIEDMKTLLILSFLHKVQVLNLLVLLGNELGIMILVTLKVCLQYYLNNLMLYVSFCVQLSNIIIIIYRHSNVLKCNRGVHILYRC